MQEDPLTVGLVQTTLFWEDVTANLALLEEKTAALPPRTDVIVLPEMFPTGFSMEPDRVAEGMNLQITRWLQHLAARTGALVIGSFAAKEEGRYFNRLLAVRPDKAYHQYDKRHLFRMGGETDVYTAGLERIVLEWKGWRICPLICYDLRFPVWSRNVPDNPYDLLVYVANWPAARGDAWETLLKGRAIENQSYVVGVNRIGKDGTGTAYDGRSAALNFLGEPLASLKDADTIGVAELSKTRLTTFREQFPAYLDADRFQLIVPPR